MPRSQPPSPPPKKIFVEYDFCNETAPFDEIDVLIKDKKLKEAQKRLEAMLQEPSAQCGAALYLFAIDKSSKSVIKILKSKKCEEIQPVGSRLVNKILRLKRELDRRAAAVKKKKDYAAELENELVLLEQENARLRFELQKLEEIRRETERWRFK